MYPSRFETQKGATNFQADGKPLLFKPVSGINTSVNYPTSFC
jgi:hypothetical protein